MKIIFMGSADFAGDCLEALLNHSRTRVLAVVTQPDKPKGRHLHVAPCPVKELAEQEGARVLSPEDVNDHEWLTAFRLLAPDLIVVVAYGQKLGPELLALPPRGCINMHPSLLPKYRGAAPIQWAIANGDTVTGVTSMYMTSKMDAGDIIVQREIPIHPEDTGGSLHDRLSEEAAEVLIETIEAIEDEHARHEKQDEALVTIAPKLSKEDGRIDWKLPAGEILNRVRAFDPWPGTFCKLRGATKKAEIILKVLRVTAEDGKGKPGELLSVSSVGPLVAAGQGAVRLALVQPEGKSPMSGAAFLRGHKLAVGDVLL